MRVGGCPGSASKLAANCPSLVQPACQRRRRETLAAASVPVSHLDATLERIRSRFEISAPKVHGPSTSRRVRSERTVQTNCADARDELCIRVIAKQPGRATRARAALSFQRVAQRARARLPRPCRTSSTVHGDHPKLHAQRTRARRDRRQGSPALPAPVRPASPTRWHSCACAGAA